MSEPVTALKNARYTAGIADISEIGPLGMITLRGDFSASVVQKAAVAAGGTNVPDPGHINTEGERGIAWMSPDELLVMCPYTEVENRRATLQQATAKHHALAVNVSDARAVFRVSGRHAREVMAKLAPVDLAPDQFTPSMFRRTRMAQVPAAFWMPDDQTFQVICFRSVAQYMFDLLKIAAQPGSEVGHF